MTTKTTDVLTTGDEPMIGGRNPMKTETLYVNENHPMTQEYRERAANLIARLENFGYEAYDVMYVDELGRIRSGTVQAMRPDRGEMTLDEIDDVVGDMVDRRRISYAPTDYDCIEIRL